MSQLKRVFDLNSAITALDEGGRFDEQLHKEQVLPIRPHLMNHDGMTGCVINRYDIEVQFLDHVTDLETVKRHVAEAVQWAASNGLFPLRGDKTPSATYRDPAAVREPEQHVWCRVRFSSWPVQFPPSSEHNGIDEAAFRLAYDDLATRLTHHDGVTNFEIYLDCVKVKFDSNVVSKEQIEAHLIDVLNEAVNEPDYFPYAEGHVEFVVTFE